MHANYRSCWAWPAILLATTYGVLHSYWPRLMVTMTSSAVSRNCIFPSISLIAYVYALALAGLLIWEGPFLARLNGPSSGGLYGPLVARLAAKKQTGVVPLGRYITAHGPSMARLLNAARAILARLVFSNKKAWALLQWKFRRAALSYVHRRILGGQSGTCPQ